MDYSIVTDASIALKWYVRDEVDAEPAFAILLDYEQGRFRFIVPRLFYYEIVNAVHIAVRRKRITEEEGRDIIKDTLYLQMAVSDSPEILRNTYRLARKYNISVYDAVYLSTAKENSSDFYTADRKLYEALKGKENSVRWIGDYHMNKQSR